MTFMAQEIQDDDFDAAFRVIVIDGMTALPRMQPSLAPETPGASPHRGFAAWPALRRALHRLLAQVSGRSARAMRRPA